jgi:hypothetical protein
MNEGLGMPWTRTRARIEAVEGGAPDIYHSVCDGHRRCGQAFFECLLPSITMYQGSSGNPDWQMNHCGTRSRETGSRMLQATRGTTVRRSCRRSRLSVFLSPIESSPSFSSTSAACFLAFGGRRTTSILQGTALSLDSAVEGGRLSSRQDVSWPCLDRRGGLFFSLGREPAIDFSWLIHAGCRG